MRIVLDTNSLIQSIPEHSPYFSVWLSVLRGDNTLCVTNEILEEYAEILQRLAGRYTAEYVLDAIVKSKHVEMITAYYHFGLISVDPDDNKFVDCAIAANARYIVTNDRHYDVLRQVKFPAVDVIALKDFLALIHQ